MMNNDIKNQQRELKEIYDLCCDYLEIFIKDTKNKESQLNFENQMDRFFFEVERCAAASHSLYDTELHDIGKWFADTSRDALEALVCYQQLMKKIKKENYYSPSEKALSSMQSLVRTYLDKTQVSELRKLLSDHSITTHGFDEKRKFQMTKTYERVLSIILGVVSLVCFALLIIFMDEPTPLKYNLISVFVSLLAGLSAALLTGSLYLKVNDKLNAKSGYAVFGVSLLVLNGIKFI